MKVSKPIFANLLPNWLPWQHPQIGRKTDVRFIISAHISINPENLVKVDLVHLEITGPQEEYLKEKKTAAQHSARAAGRPDGLNC